VRILLTGAAGFVGSHLSDRLVADGHSVIGVDNLSSGRLSNLAQLRDAPHFEFVEADASAPLSVHGPFDWVMHFASPASPPRYMRDPIATLMVNSEGTRHLLELARENGAAFFLASTSEVYGNPLEHPQPETYWGNVNPIGPRSVYDEAKRYGEAMAMAFRRQYGLTLRISRIFNTYGPRMHPEDGRVVSNLIVQALRGQPMTVYGDGQQTRSFQYVDDLVEGIVRLMGAKFDLPVNLGNPVEWTMLELGQLVRSMTETSSELIFEPLPIDDPLRRRPDISLARELLGWEPHVPLEEGLRTTIDAFRAELGSQPRVEARSS
jgi:nucleoside-diphosphate-sugar epimerase